MSPTCDICGEEFSEQRRLDSHFGIAHDTPWQNEEILRELRQQYGLSTYEIADKLGCSHGTVHRWLKRFDIKDPVGYFTTPDKGYEKWRAGESSVYVHRLLAVSEYGVDEVKDKVVHHVNGVPWDNRPENIEVLQKSDHHTEHRKAQGKERKAIAYAYEFTDMSSYDIAETCDYSAGSVIRIHSEYFS
jgi:transposase